MHQYESPEAFCFFKIYIKNISFNRYSTVDYWDVAVPRCNEQRRQQQPIEQLCQSNWRSSSAVAAASAATSATTTTWTQQYDDSLQDKSTAQRYRPSVW